VASFSCVVRFQKNAMFCKPKANYGDIN
jgi:hypothetical protein